jgi:hypothetical protein
MVLLVKINEELADVFPQFLTNRGEAFHLFYLLPVGNEQFVDSGQGNICEERLESVIFFPV